jgi:hypothetical protein
MIMIIGSEDHTPVSPTHADLLFVSAAGHRQPQVYAATSVATRKRGILGLRVHTHGRSVHAEE